MLVSLLALTLVGCDAVSGLFGGDEPPVAAPPAPPPPKELGAQVADARRLLLAGKASDALQAAEALLASHPEDDGLWDLVELAAIRAGAAGALVDRLSADTAIGGRADRHHALRGVLAVEANRLGDALNAARALEAVAPGDAAAIVALAVAKGAPPPAGLGAGAAALVAALDPAAPLDPAVAALPGWRAALVRADARLARGDRSGAAVDATVAEAGGPRARTLGALVRIRAARSGAEAWTSAEAAARGAVDGGDAVGASEVLDAVLPVAAGAWKARPLADLANELRARATEAGNAEAAARLAAVEADAALRAGAPLRASEAVKVAAGLPAVQVRAAWAAALAGAALGNAADIDAAAGALPEPRAAAARDLARALRGQSPTLPSAGLAGADAALQALLGAGFASEPAAVYAAAAAAASADDADLRLWASLAAGRAAPATRADASTAPLEAELAARAWLAGGAPPAALPGTVDHPAAAGWAALLGGAPVGSDAPGVGAWARARAALAGADAAGAAAALEGLAAASPAWRTGPWAPLLVLDGPVPDDVEADAARNRATKDPVPFAVVHHGWSARHGAASARWRRGIPPFPATTTAAQRAAVWDAAAAARAGVLAWVAGAEPWPQAAYAALEQAETAAGLVRSGPPSLETLRSSLDGDAVISFRVGPSGVEALYVGEERARVELLPASLPREVAAFVAELRAGRSALAAGDRLRQRVLDPAMDVLLGVGRYLVVGPGALGILPVAALPEQADGVRFLASIRHVGHLPDLDAILPAPNGERPATVSVLALCADPGEAAAVRRVYTDAVVLEGAEATVAAYREQAPRARNVQLGAWPVAPDGGWMLADGALSLADLASVPLAAGGAVVDGGADADVLAARVAALRQAGAREVLVEAWASETRFRESLLQHYWEGVNRRHGAARALAEARELAIREVGDAAREPSAWGGYFAAGRP